MFAEDVDSNEELAGGVDDDDNISELSGNGLWQVRRCILIPHHVHLVVADVT